MTLPAVPHSPGYGNGFDRVRTLSVPEDGRFWFHQTNRVGADLTAPRP